MTISVEVRDDGRVQTWWLDRPTAHNAISLEMWETLITLSESVRHDSRVRAVIIRGRNGDFSAGADIRGLGTTIAADHDGSRYRQINADAEAALAGLPCPTIAAIEGYCVGGAVLVAMACDLRVAHHAAQFAITPAKLGVTYPATAVRRLVASIGAANTSWLLLTARLIDAADAHRIGLIHQITNNLDTDVDVLVTTLISRSPVSQAATKSAIASVVDHVDVRQLTEQLEQSSLEAGDLHEGLSAFLEKREPHFGERPMHRER
jgi:enoyl-CoA hydratase/carnithine racemase